jgi:hypothetical protein
MGIIPAPTPIIATPPMVNPVATPVPIPMPPVVTPVNTMTPIVTPTTGIVPPIIVANRTNAADSN